MECDTVQNDGGKTKERVENDINNVIRGREFFSFAHCIGRSNRTVIVKKVPEASHFPSSIWKAKVSLTSVTLDKTRFVSGAQMIIVDYQRL